MIERLLSKIYKIFIAVRRRAYRYKGQSYGLLEAIFWPYIDMWQRYASITDEILTMKNSEILILDVGGAGGIISYFIREPRYRVVLVDVDRRALSGIGREVSAVVADGNMLPFKNDIFDVVTSVATLEHIPESYRGEFYEELKRATRRKVIIYTPLVDDDGIYKGGEYDIKFYEVYKRSFGIEDSKTAEHIKAGHPTLWEIGEAFPNSIIKGMQNCDVWYTLQILQAKPIPLLTGSIYKLFLGKHENKSPYYACKVTWLKQ